MGNQIRSIFAFFFKIGLRSKKTRLFFLISLIPSIVFIIMQIVRFTSTPNLIDLNHIYPNIQGGFYFQLFIQLISLLLGSSIINDEIDNQTLIYLTTSPVQKKSILWGKFAAYYIVSLMTITISMILAFIIAFFPNMYTMSRIIDLVKGLLIAMLAVLAYSALFTFLETFMKKTILLGIAFIFGWEKIIQFFPGITQKLTINHFINSLLPVSQQPRRGFLSAAFQATPEVVSVIVLLLLTLICLAIGSYIFDKREYILADSI